MGEHPSEHQHQRDQQAADAAIAVQERVNRLELIMSDGELDEERHVVVMQEPLEVVERIAHRIGRGRHEYRIHEVCAADPYWAGAELSGPAVLASGA